MILEKDSGEAAGPMETFERACRAQGYSVTRQRKALYQALIARRDHPTPESLFEDVRGELPSLSLATVYKSIEAFREMGLINEVHPLRERMRLDGNLEPHHHLICVRCQAVIDVPAASVPSAEAALQLAPGERQGFRVFSYSVSFSGLCPECQRGAAPSSGLR